MSDPRPVPAVLGRGLKRNRPARPIGRRIALGFGVTLAVLLGLGLGYQALGAASDRRAYPPPGRLVDVGGHRLHLYCTGAGVPGEPTVVLETLSGGLSTYWARVQPALAKVGRVCSYDRAGRGWSEPSPHRLSARRTAKELHTLLGNAGIAGPYVLVGHSIGGLYVRTYAKMYQGEVAGVVLLDASHPQLFSRSPDAMASNRGFLRESAAFPALARLGVFRLFFALGGEIDFGELPTKQHAATAAFWSTPNYLASVRKEFDAIEQIYAETGTLGPLGELPLLVVTAGAGASPVWLELQAELEALSARSSTLLLPEASHTSLVFGPEQAGRTSQAIARFVRGLMIPMVAPY